MSAGAGRFILSDNCCKRPKPLVSCLLEIAKDVGKDSGAEGRLCADTRNRALDVGGWTRPVYFPAIPSLKKGTRLLLLLSTGRIPAQAVSVCDPYMPRQAAHPQETMIGRIARRRSVRTRTDRAPPKLMRERWFENLASQPLSKVYVHLGKPCVF